MDKCVDSYFGELLSVGQVGIIDAKLRLFDDDLIRPCTAFSAVEYENVSRIGYPPLKFLAKADRI